MKGSNKVLGLGFLVGLILYANMTRPKGKLGKEKEPVIHRLD